jgi:hypothetical protein
MSLPIQIEFNPSDVARIQTTMRRMVMYLHKEMGEAVKAGAWYVARAAGAATKIAPKTRKIVPNPEYRSSYITGFWEGSMAMKWAVLRYRKDRSTMLKPVKGETREDAKASRAARIGRRGLAKDSWSWMLGSMGKPMLALHTRRMAGISTVSKSIGGDNPSVLLENRLRYAMDAFLVKGRATVSNIMSRAANSMAASMNRKIAKATT